MKAIDRFLENEIGNRFYTVAGTGHRPTRLGLDYSSGSNRRLTEFATEALKRLSPHVVISGMALGYDLALAHAAILSGIKLVAAVPFEGQECKWPSSAQDRYHAILKRASEVHVVCPGGYAASKMMDRDKWMVENALAGKHGVLLALWDGKRSGGTWHTVSYAQTQGLFMLNLWEDWIGVRSNRSFSCQNKS